MTITPPTVRDGGFHLGNVSHVVHLGWQPGEGPAVRGSSAFDGPAVAVTLRYSYDFGSREWRVEIGDPRFRVRLKSGEYGIERRSHSYYSTSTREALSTPRAIGRLPEWLRDLALKHWPTSTFRVIEDHAGTEHNPEGA